MGDYGDSHYWQKRVQELEEKIEQLRFSRRVLMNLIERLERERCNSLTHLEHLKKENRKLHSLSLRYARFLLQKNIQIRKLEAKLQSGGNWELGVGDWGKEEKLP